MTISLSGADSLQPPVLWQLWHAGVCGLGPQIVFAFGPRVPAGTRRPRSCKNPNALQFSEESS
jgi:hypothetical protein